MFRADDVSLRQLGKGLQLGKLNLIVRIRSARFPDDNLS